MKTHCCSRSPGTMSGKGPTVVNKTSKFAVFDVKGGEEKQKGIGSNNSSSSSTSQTPSSRTLVYCRCSTQQSLVGERRGLRAQTAAVCGDAEVDAESGVDCVRNHTAPEELESLPHPTTVGCCSSLRLPCCVSHTAF